MNSPVPISRWDVAKAGGGHISAAYGAFVSQGTFSFDAAAFGISKVEAQGMDPQMMLVLETSYSSLQGSGPSSMCRASLTNAPVGFFLGGGFELETEGCAVRPVPALRTHTDRQNTVSICDFLTTCYYLVQQSLDENLDVSSEENGA